MRKVTPPSKLQTYQLIIRCTWHGGNIADRDACYAELTARGCWLTEEQKIQAGIK